jgi:hypothetical protein
MFLGLRGGGLGKAPANPGEIKAELFVVGIIERVRGPVTKTALGRIRSIGKGNIYIIFNRERLL